LKFWPLFSVFITWRLKVVLPGDLEVTSTFGGETIKEKAEILPISKRKVNKMTLVKRIFFPLTALPRNSYLILPNLHKKTRRVGYVKKRFSITYIVTEPGVLACTK